VIGSDVEVRIGRRKYVGSNSPAVLKEVGKTHPPRLVSEGDPRKNRGNLPVPLAQMSIEEILDRKQWSPSCARLLARSAARIWWNATADGRVFRGGSLQGRYGRFTEVRFEPADRSVDAQVWLIPEVAGHEIRSTGMIEKGTTIAKLQNLGHAKTAVAISTREGLTLDGQTYVLASMVNDEPLTGTPVWRIPKTGVLPVCDFTCDETANPAASAEDLDFGNGTSIFRRVRAPQLAVA